MSDEIIENQEGLENLQENGENPQIETNPTDNQAPASGENPEDGKEEGKEDDKKDDTEVYGSPETFDYSEIKLPDGMELDKELLQEFEPIAKKFNLSNKSANELMSLAVKLADKNMAKFNDVASQIQEAKKASYLQLLNEDKDLNVGNSEQYEQYLDVAIKGLKAVATPGFTEFMKNENLTHHPEFIKTFHKIGELCNSDTIPSAKFPAGQSLDPADVLYGKKEG